MGRMLFQIVYFLTFLTLFVLVLLSVYGYSYDFQTKEITRLGVIGMTSSNVASAQVTVDTGKVLEEAYFPLAVHDVPVGEHVIEVQKPSYQPWKHMMEVDEYYVTELGNVVLTPEDMSAVQQKFPERVDRCFFPEQQGLSVVCIEDQKKLAYVLQIIQKRNISTTIIEIETEGLERVHWIDRDRLLFYFSESLPLVYRFSTKQWEPLPLPAEQVALLSQGLWKEQYLFIHRPAPEEEQPTIEKINMLTGQREATSDTPVEELVVDQGKLWVRERNLWKSLDERILIPRDPAFTTLPSQVPDWNTRLSTAAHTVYSNDTNAVIYMDPKTKRSQVIATFPEKVLGAAEAIHQEYIRVWTESNQYYCHQERIEACIHIGTYIPESYWDKTNHIWFAQEEDMLHIWDLTLDVANERFAPVQLLP